MYKGYELVHSPAEPINRGGLICRLCDLPFFIKCDDDGARPRCSISGQGNSAFFERLGGTTQTYSRQFGIVHTNRRYLRTICCLLMKGDGWVQEETDLPYTSDSKTWLAMDCDITDAEPLDYGLTASHLSYGHRIGPFTKDSNPSQSPHGVSYVTTCALPECQHERLPGWDQSQPFGIPFHSHCIRLWADFCMYRFGTVDFDSLWHLSEENGHLGFKNILQFRDPNVRFNHGTGNGLWFHSGSNINTSIWCHHEVSGYLALNPSDGRELGRVIEDLLNSCRYSIPHPDVDDMYGDTPYQSLTDDHLNGLSTFDPRSQIFSHDYYLHRARQLKTPVTQIRPQEWKYFNDGADPSKDPFFAKLPYELMLRILEFCSPSSAVNLACSTRQLRGLQGLSHAHFRDLVREQFYWFPLIMDITSLKYGEPFLEDCWGYTYTASLDMFLLHRFLRHAVNEYPIMRARARLFTEFEWIADWILWRNEKLGLSGEAGNDEEANRRNEDTMDELMCGTFGSIWQQRDGPWDPMAGQGPFEDPLAGME